MRRRFRSAIIAIAASFFGTQCWGCDATSTVLAIDVGHTLARSGATSARGVPEFTFNLALSRAIRDAIQRHGTFRAVLINEDGKIQGLPQRPAAAEAAGATLFLAIHHDSVQKKYIEKWTVENTTRQYSDKFSGFSVFVSNKNKHFDESSRLATEIARALLAREFKPTLHHAEPIQGESRPLIDPDLGLYRFDGLAVLRHAQIPAVLLEAGVIVNRDDEMKLSQPETRKRIAEAIVAALERFCQEKVIPDAIIPSRKPGTGTEAEPPQESPR